MSTLSLTEASKPWISFWPWRPFTNTTQNTFQSASSALFSEARVCTWRSWSCVYFSFHFIATRTSNQNLCGFYLRECVVSCTYVGHTDAVLLLLLLLGLLVCNEHKIKKVLSKVNDHFVHPWFTTDQEATKNSSSSIFDTVEIFTVSNARTISSGKEAFPYCSNVDTKYELLPQFVRQNKCISLNTSKNCSAPCLLLQLVLPRYLTSSGR